MRLAKLESQLADRLGRWKARYPNTGLPRGIERLLKFLGIKQLPTTLEVTLGECVLTRGKYRRRSMVNNVVKGKAHVIRVFITFDKEPYEVVRQWKTEKGFTVSEIIHPLEPVESEEFLKPKLKEGQRLRITRYGCVWHLFHRYTMALNSFFYTGRFLDMGSSVEVYPQEYEII